MKGSWFSRTPNPPCTPGARTSSQVTERTRRSGVTMSRVMAIGCPQPLRGGELLRLLDRLLDAADHVEGLLGELVVPALHDLLEAADRVLQLDVLALVAGELLRDVERLREEALDLAGTGDGELVVLGELVHPEDGDDVLEVLVPLQRLLDLAGDVVMLHPDDEGIEDAARRVERVDGGVDADLGELAGEHRRRVEVRERGRGGWVGEVVSGHVDRL